MMSDHTANLPSLRSIDTFNHLPPCPSRVLPPLRIQLPEDCRATELSELPPLLKTDAESVEWFIKLISTTCNKFGTRFELADFVQHSAEGLQCLVTTALPSYHDAWLKSGVELPLQSLYDITSLIWNLTNKHKASEDTGSDAARMLHAIMGEYMEKFCQLVTGNAVIKGKDDWSHEYVMQVMATSPSHLRISANWASSVLEIVAERFLDSGKCVYTCLRIVESLGLQDAFYVSQLQSLEQMRDHANCNLTECVGHQIDPKTHVRAHTQPGCQCKIVDADVDAVIKILEAPGLIPVIVFESGSEIRLSIVPHTEVDAYVTISYAASQIFASPLSNSMSTCQLISLRYIARVCSRIIVGKGKRCGVWIDTLLVPVRQIQTSSREQALVKMKLTFEQADVVLVVDPVMASRAATDFVAEEFMGYILCSPWFTRLWTFVESQIATSLWVWYAGEPHVLDSFIQQQGWPPKGRFWRKYDALETLGNLRSFSRRLAEYPEYLDKERSSHAYFEVVLENLRHRMTSQPADEAFCLSLLLNLDVNRVLNAPAAQRMEAVWCQIRNVSAMLLIQSGHRLTVPGLRWAPTTLIGHKEVTRRGHPDDYTIRKAGYGIKVPDNYIAFLVTVIRSDEPTPAPCPTKKLFFQVRNTDFYGAGNYAFEADDGGWCLIRLTMSIDPTIPLTGEEDSFTPPGEKFILLMRGLALEGITGPCVMLKIESDVEADLNDPDFGPKPDGLELSQVFTSYHRLGGFSVVELQKRAEVRARFQLNAAFEGTNSCNEERTVCAAQRIDMEKEEIWVS